MRLGCKFWHEYCRSNVSLTTYVFHQEALDVIVGDNFDHMIKIILGSFLLNGTICPFINHRQSVGRSFETGYKKIGI